MAKESLSNDYRKMFLDGKFLGQNITKTLDYRSDSIIMHGVSSVNGYVGRHPEEIKLMQLNIASISNAMICEEDPILVVGENKYFPLLLNITYFKKNTSVPNLYIPKSMVYIEGLKRPNIHHLADKLSTLFLSNYGGGYHFKCGRYVVCLDNFSENYIATLLYIAKNEDGSRIDHSWIAPLQDVMEFKSSFIDSSKQNRRKKESPLNVKRSFGQKAFALEGKSGPPAHRFGGHDVFLNDMLEESEVSTEENEEDAEPIDPHRPIKRSAKNILPKWHKTLFQTINKGTSGPITAVNKDVPVGQEDIALESSKSTLETYLKKKQTFLDSLKYNGNI